MVRHLINMRTWDIHHVSTVQRLVSVLFLGCTAKYFEMSYTIIAFNSISFIVESKFRASAWFSFKQLFILRLIQMLQCTYIIAMNTAIPIPFITEMKRENYFLTFDIVMVHCVYHIFNVLCSDQLLWQFTRFYEIFACIRCIMMYGKRGGNLIIKQVVALFHLNWTVGLLFRWNILNK